MLSLLLAALSSPSADAAAFYFVDTGTKGMARSGAFVAGADDLSAQFYNPAALIHLDRPQVYFDFSLFQQGVKFTRMDYAADGSLEETFPEIENGAPPMAIPAFGVGHHFGLPNTYFAFGLWTPVAPTLSYPAEGSQHYTLQDSLTWQIWAGPSVAHRFGWLTIGGGVHWTLVRAEQSLSLIICQDDDPTDNEIGSCPDTAMPEDNDLWAEVRAWDKASLSGNLGILAEPVDWLSIGLSAVPPLNVKARGDLEVEMAEDHWLLEGDGDGNYKLLGDGHAIDEDVLVKLTMPWVFRAGVAVRPVPEVEIELASVYQGWHATEEIRVTEVELTLKDNPENVLLEEDQVITDDVVLPAGYKDSYSIRLGADADLSDVFSLRGGTYFETGAIPEQLVTVALVDNDKVGFSLGGSALIADHLSIDLGFIQTFFTTLNIKNSDVHRFEVPVDLFAVYGGEPLVIKEGEVVGNGSYKSSATMGSIGLTYLWGRRQSEDIRKD